MTQPTPPNITTTTTATAAIGTDDGGNTDNNDNGNGNDNNNNVEDNDNNTDNNNEETNDNTDSLSNVLVQEVRYADGGQKQYNQMYIEESKRHTCKFQLPKGETCSVRTITDLYLNDNFLRIIVNNTNAYIKVMERENVIPSIGCDEIMIFLAILFYMTIVKLPSKKDYWSTHGLWPTHIPCTKMSYERFQQIWFNIQLAYPGTKANVGGDDGDDDDGDGSDDEQDNEQNRHQRHHRDIFQRYDSDNHHHHHHDDDDDDDDNEELISSKWYKKVEILIERINKISKLICQYPGYALCMNEMMKSKSTNHHHPHCTAQLASYVPKTIKSRRQRQRKKSKFWALYDSQTGFVYHFCPAMTTKNKNKKQFNDDSYDDDDVIVRKSTISFIDQLPKRNKLKYVIGMDKYFTYPGIIQRARERGVAVVGTAKPRKRNHDNNNDDDDDDSDNDNGNDNEWPPIEIRTITDENFNTLYWMNDRLDFQIYRWFDSIPITMISSYHVPEPTIVRKRYRPKSTNSNRLQLEAIWGSDRVKSIQIPVVVDDYNHLMSGVDKSNQLIDNYRAVDLLKRCQEWMPLMMHCLDVFRINSYIIYNSLCDGEKLKKLSQKDFILAVIEKLLDRAAYYSYFNKGSIHEEVTKKSKPASSSSSTTCPAASDSSLPTAKRQRRLRFSHTAPELPAGRFMGNPSMHLQVQSKKRGRCKMCSYLNLVHKTKKLSGPPPSVRSVYKECAACRVFICDKHFEAYHDKGNNKNNCGNKNNGTNDGVMSSSDEDDAVGFDVGVSARL